MAINTTPVFQAKATFWTGLTPATASTSTTAPANTTVLGTGATDGTRIREIVAVVNATTASACVVRIFTKASGVFTLYDEILIPATTVAQTTATTRLAKPYEEFVLTSGRTLEISVSTSVGQSTISVSAEGWDYTP